MTFARSVLALAAFAAGIAGFPSARATSVIPPTFPELVAEADAIVRGRVTDIAVRRTAAPDGTQIGRAHV